MKAAEAPTDLAHSLPERSVSILNGMFGDYLQRRGNDLAIDMSFRHHGQPLQLNAASLRAANSTLARKLCVLVHGLCCNESIWTFSATANTLSCGRLSRASVRIKSTSRSTTIF